MFKIYLIRKIINFIDSFQQKKIFNILKRKLKPKAILFDVGAHHGETIRNFKNNFDFEQIHSFEVSKQNFEVLSKNYKDFENKKIIINNFGLSNKSKELQFNQFIESSSSTISKINVKSLYFKRKIKILGFLKNNRDYYETSKVQLNSLDNFCFNLGLSLDISSRVKRYSWGTISTVFLDNELLTILYFERISEITPTSALDAIVINKL